MAARRASIHSRHKQFMMPQAGPADFHPTDEREVSAETVPEDPRWSSFCLDLDRWETQFVKTPQTLDLTAAPFLFQSQFLNASEVIAIIFDTFHKLADTIQPNSS